MRVIKNTLVEDLEQAGFSLQEGWDTTIANQLVEKARESHIIQFTPRDSTERFVDTETANQWYAKERKIVYGLFQAAELSGVVWYSQQTKEGVETAEYTMAIRMYEIARGKRLGGALLTATEEDFRKQYNYRSGIWLQASSKNQTATELYQKQGYRKISAVSDDERVVMVKSE